MEAGASAVFRHPDGWLVFRRPVRLQTARNPAEVIRTLAPVDQPPSGGGTVCAVAYEAAPAFDDALSAWNSGSLPVAVVIEFEDAVVVADRHGSGVPVGILYGTEDARPVVFGRWEPEQGRQAYGEGYRRVRRELEAGNTYQVNYTHRYRAPLLTKPRRSDLCRLFFELARRNEAAYAAFLDTPELSILSISPELFYERRGRKVRSKPMKGTAPRGTTDEQDDRLQECLATSEKDQAENLMIVDMIRNDLGRVADAGSVRVPSLFSVERYPTVHQMTSEVVADTSARETELLSALFPCASITGAPKASSMAIIREVEPSRRGFYTGTVGYVLPGGRSRWNVAIRTITVDKRTSRAEYGSGGGVVWDSEEESEHQELLLKARVLDQTAPSFELLETMLRRADGTIWLLDRHLARLVSSGDELGFHVDEGAIRAAIERATAAPRAARNPPDATDPPDAADQPASDRWMARASREPVMIRLLLAADGSARCETIRLADRPVPDPLPVAVDTVAVDSSDLFLRHKTTYRRVYHDASARHPEAREVFLVNECGELTEGTFSTIVLELDGRLVTPAADCGLLPGCYRQELLESGRISEKHLVPADLERATAVYAVNSVRGFMRCRVEARG